LGTRAPRADCEKEEQVTDTSDARPSLLYARSLSLLATITEECEALNALLAADEITQKQARVRVQNIHGLAATPQVEEWPRGGAALRDLIAAVDSVCQSDVAGDEPTLEPHARSVLELALQRARDGVG
jgi:histidine ammonia-lyase